MRQNKNAYIKKVKNKNMSSNILVTMNVIFGIIPNIIVIFMAGLMMDGGITKNIVLMCGIGIAVCLALKALFYGLSIWKAHDAAYGSLTEIRIDIIEHLKTLPLRFFQKRKTGDLVNIINHDVEEVEGYLAHALPEIVAATLVPAVIFIAVLLIDWRMGLALICTVPLMFLFSRVANKFFSDSFKRYFDSTKKLSEDLLEYISTISVIKAFSREEQKTQNILDGIRNYNRWVKKFTLSLTVPMRFIDMILEGGFVVMAIVGSLLLMDGQISTQGFVLALILGEIFTASFAKLQIFQHNGYVFNGSMNSIFSVLNEEPSMWGDRYPSPNSGDIVFDEVCFAYTAGEETLSNINLCFKKNSVNAIVGASGSGKSTLASLIMGFWLPDSGKISIGGQNISDMSEKALSSLTSIVQQEVFLFNLFIEENIRIGKPDATHEEIVEAAKKAQIHDFIMSLPQGYGTLTGEAGVKFSGGEKQRISIARMMLKNAPIIILDEATAAIDPSNEHLIQKAISNLGEDKTLIMIAHHLNTITNADQIVVMDEGRVIDTGRHEELIASCPLYSEMAEQQTKVDTWQIKEVSA
ncbi:MAG: ABC transporter ATP-binding protein [Anaerotignum sp.]|nr:ABC transporter ATP-binding protein [Anaerotignum sp.]